MSGREQLGGETPKPIFVLHLVAGPTCPNAIRALRALLKIALRRFGLRCVSVERALK